MRPSEKDSYRRELIQGQSARLIAGYIYANAGEGESTTDLVFGGHNIIAENGTILAEAKRFENEIIYTELDMHRLISETAKKYDFPVIRGEEYSRGFHFPYRKEETGLTRTFPSRPFVPSSRDRDGPDRCEEILTIQAMGLKKRSGTYSSAGRAVVGISGGLDSTLALVGDGTSV